MGYDEFISIMKSEVESFRLRKRAMRVSDIIKRLSSVRDKDMVLIYDDGYCVSLDSVTECDKNQDVIVDDQSLHDDCVTSAQGAIHDLRNLDASYAYVREHVDGAKSYINDVIIDTDYSDELFGGAPRVVLVCYSAYDD